jgi:hypothetical protein
LAKANPYFFVENPLPNQVIMPLFMLTALFSRYLLVSQEV